MSYRATFIAACAGAVIGNALLYLISPDYADVGNVISYAAGAGTALWTHRDGRRK